jgi:predicted dehydrogenase
VVPICSPHRFHAPQVTAACRAGKRAVLCEKPFAMSGDGYQAMDQRRAINVLLRP